jgi:Inorganic Pyrophosphatase
MKDDRISRFVGDENAEELSFVPRGRRKASVSRRTEPKTDALTLLRIELGHTDAFPTYKTRVKTPAGTLGITHQPGDKRFGRPMMANYGHLLGSYGKAEDGKAWDFYLGDDPDNEGLYEVLQTTPDGLPDERKFITHCRDRDHAREVFLSHAGRDRLGYIRPAGWDFFE